ncbi:uncharacterized protein KY384_008310 [Bacidia gigantensis]|uniref:uncharacterized protein n=1 Tax=Bacidia gigantensis TaxID=2732470 RepID=UPI001D05A8A6|nr:uncharacterized protein KY384_008310 [Bacidia gigantensis]KAG8526881.1 hypothetical protein KY384_008310 [Bacidia gigantensis]
MALESKQAEGYIQEPVSQRVLSTREKIIVLEGSKLHGCRFPPWSPLVPASEFKDSFQDDTNFQLSQAQYKELNSWRRCSDIFDVAGKIMSASNGQADSSCQDLVQDMTTDCSVVASLCAITNRTERGFTNLFAGIFHPWNPAKSSPGTSSNGKYIFRLYFNGANRKVVIDDRLPVSKTERNFFVTDRNCKSLLWPALIEKAYLKMRGGYDFPGSNSGTDLWIISSWIPEQLFLQRLLKAFHYGDVLITTGTGKISETEENVLGLIGEHDYTVLGLKEQHGRKLFLIKNPWSRGMSWKGDDHTLGGLSENLHHLGLGASMTKDHPEHCLTPGTFWMTLDHVFENFESLYLNWNPGLFRYRTDLHLYWDLTNIQKSGGNIRTNPQYIVNSPSGGLVWLLLSRHFISRLPAGQGHGGPSTRDASEGFISLYAFKDNSYRVIIDEGASATSDYVDSPNTLLKLDMAPGSSYAIVLAEQSLPRTRLAFTISCFSLSPTSIEQAKDLHAHKHVFHGRWTKSSAGGNASGPAYHSNPQYRIQLMTSSDLVLSLESIFDAYLVHVALILTSDKYLRTVASRDIIGNSGAYRKGFAVAEIEEVPAGSYIIVCSTFERGQLGDLNLHVSSTAYCDVKRVPIFGAGRFEAAMKTASFAPEIDRLVLPILTHRINCISVTASSKTSDRSSMRPELGSPLRVAIASGRGSSMQTIAASSNGDFTDTSHGGAYVQDVTMQVTECNSPGVFIVLERLGTSGSSQSEAVDILIQSDELLQLGQWIGEEAKVSF